MKIFRGPSTKPFNDDSHELVSEIEAGKSATFVKDSVILVANITKQPEERQAVAHVQLDAVDLLALHRRLITGLEAKSNELDKLTLRTRKVSQALYELYERLNGADPDWNPQGELAHACDVVGTLAHELDVGK